MMLTFSFSHEFFDFFSLKFLFMGDGKKHRKYQMNGKFNFFSKSINSKKTLRIVIPFKVKLHNMNVIQ